MEVLKRFLGLDRMSEVLLAGTVCYLAYAAVFSLYTRWRKKGKIHCRVKLQMEEHRTEVDAFFDTGNGLYDSVLQRPVSIIRKETLEKLCDADTDGKITGISDGKGRKRTGCVLSETASAFPGLFQPWLFIRVTGRCHIGCHVPGE